MAALILPRALLGVPALAFATFGLFSEPVTLTTHGFLRLPVSLLGFASGLLALLGLETFPLLFPAPAIP
jgi:hypothetical protein